MGRGGGREKKKETSERSRERGSPRVTRGLDTGAQSGGRGIRAMGVQLRGGGPSALERPELGNQGQRPEQWSSQLAGIMQFSPSIVLNPVKDHFNTSS